MSFQGDEAWNEELSDVMAKRHLGSALNTRYGTWHYKNENIAGDESDLGKRTLEDILDEIENHGNVMEKRRIGSALNARYGTWRYRQPDVDSYEAIQNSKRFLGPALDVRYRHFGSPFYRLAGSWPSKRPFPKASRPLWSGRMRRSADEDASTNVEEETKKAEGKVKLHHKGASRRKQNRRRQNKRHLGAALGQGFAWRPLTKYRPSAYLKPNEAVRDQKAEARMVKLMG